MTPQPIHSEDCTPETVMEIDRRLAPMRSHDAMQSVNPIWLDGPFSNGDLSELDLGPGPIMPLAEFQSASHIQVVGVPLCPDLLRYEEIGAADGLRGHVVRGFFWLLRIWPT